MRVAIIHEWLTTYAGSERVLEQIIRIYPDADLFAVVDFLPDGQREFLQGRAVRTSFMQRMPFSRKLFRQLLFLMPIAIEQFDLSGYDLVISSSHAVAKGVLTGPDQCHVSYVHSPIRYAWDLQHQYLQQSGLQRGVKATYAKSLLHWMRMWDTRTANGVDLFVANSRYIARRIWKAYRREATVIAPPVNVEAFRPGNGKGKSYLTASRLVPYKRIDLVVQAFAAMPDRQLVVVGAGPELQAVQAAAAGAPNIVLRGEVPHAELVRLMQEARAFVFVAEEDFGITMVEVQACGTPVLAYGRGGARDILRVDLDDRPTGLFIEEQTSASISDAVDRFERNEALFTVEACRENALRFSEDAFRRSFSTAVNEAYAVLDAAKAA